MFKWGLSVNGLKRLLESVDYEIQQIYNTNMILMGYGCLT